MEMISVTKFNRMDDILFAARVYESRLEGILYNLLLEKESLNSAFFEKKTNNKDKILCLVTSDGGLCGVYNNNVIRAAEQFIFSAGRDKVKLVIAGARGYNYFKNRNIKIINTFLGINGRYSNEVARKITDTLVGLFLSEEVGEVYIAYTHFENALVLKPVVEKVLDIEPKKGNPVNYIFDSDILGILDDLINQYVFMKIRLMLLDSFTSEHAARSVAMRSATSNAKDLLHALILLRNKVRQANITREIMEITSSAEALKG